MRRHRCISQALDVLVMICLASVKGGCEGSTAFVWYGGQTAEWRERDFLGIHVARIASCSRRFVLFAHFISVGVIVTLILLRRWDALPFSKAVFVSCEPGANVCTQTPLVFARRNWHTQSALAFSTW